MSTDDTRLDFLEPIAHYELANRAPYLPLQLINSLQDRQKEEFLYLLDRFTCDYMKEQKIQLEPQEPVACLNKYFMGETDKHAKRLLSQYFELTIKIFKLINDRGICMTRDLEQVREMLKTNGNTDPIQEILDKVDLVRGEISLIRPLHMLFLSYHRPYLIIEVCMDCDENYEIVDPKQDLFLHDILRVINAIYDKEKLQRCGRILAYEFPNIDIDQSVTV
jgi:hypothetical protein